MVALLTRHPRQGSRRQYSQSFVLLALVLDFLLAGCATPAERVRAHALAFAAFLPAAEQAPLDAPDANAASLAQKEYLAKAWSIHSRAELLTLLGSIEEGTRGERHAFWSQRRRFETLPPEALFDAFLVPGEEQPMMERKLLVLTYLHAPPSRTLELTAWDFGRYIALCHWGQGAGYLSEREAWDRILPVARLLQAAFVSWDEFSADCLRGREFWSAEAMRQTGAEWRGMAAERLQTPKGLWAKIPWRESLNRGPIFSDKFVLFVQRLNEDKTHVTPMPSSGKAGSSSDADWAAASEETLRAAAEKENADAQYELARRIGQSQVRLRDPAEKWKWLYAAAENGSALAQYQLVGFTSVADQIVSSPEQNMLWLRRAADQDFGLALVDLAGHYRAGVPGLLPSDPQLGIACLRRAAEGGLISAQYLLAMACLGKMDVPGNAQEALRWFRAAALQGYAIAEAALGNGYRLGWAGGKSPTEAYFWLKLALRDTKDEPPFFTSEV
ncbi:MAG TPA: DUF1266 domain-containing protein, partial [Bryobacteraceae bacterium]|nr:DUF1266 domain-containing protein [Bryobacteraceae bacterium]